MDRSVAATSLGGAAHDLSLWGLFLQADWVVKGVMVGLLLAWAYARAEAQRLAPVEYTALIWGALWGWLIFDEAVGPATLVGGVLIVAGCWVAAQPGAIPQSPAEAAA